MTTRQTGDHATHLRTGLLLAVGLAAIAIAYWNSLQVDFVWDDHLLLGPGSPIAEGKVLDDPLGMTFWQLEHRHQTQSYYRPISTLSLALDAHLWGASARGFHATNLLLHLAACVLVFGLARRSGAGPVTASLAMTLFGIFPRLTESVTFISGRTDLLACLGALGAVALYSTERLAWKRRAGAAALLFLGLLAKEAAAAGLLAIAIIECVHQQRRERSWKTLGLRALPFAALACVYAGLRVHAGIQLGGPAFPNWPERGLYVVQALGHYVWMVLTPWNPQLVVGTLGVPQIFFLALGGLVLAAFAGLWRSRRADFWTPERLGLLALAIFALLPVLHLLPLPIRAVAADRFLYLPLAAGTILLASVGSGRSLSGFRAGGLGVAGLGLMLSFGWATHARNELWSDEVALWRASAEQHAPSNGLAESELASLLGQRGQTEEAIVHYRRALALEMELKARHPEYVVPVSLLSNLGLVLSERGQADEGIELLSAAVRQRPHEPQRRLQLGGALSRGLKFELAERHFAKALELHSGYREAAQLRAQNRRAAEIWRSLPAPTSQEAVSIQAARAEVFFLVGRLGRANELWLAVVTHPDASAEMIGAAKRSLALQQKFVGDTEGSRELTTALAGL